MSNNETKDKARELLEERANLLGVEFNPKIGDAKLAERVEAAMSADESPKDDVEVKTIKPEVKVPGKAKVLTEQEIVSQRTAELRREMMELKRVIVSCNDPQMKEWETTPPLSISNSIITLPKVVVPLNVEWHVPKAYYDMMKAQKCGIAVKSKDAKGRPVTVRKSINKYNISDLGAMSKDELKELKTVQAGRDGL